MGYGALAGAGLGGTFGAVNSVFPAFATSLVLGALSFFVRDANSTGGNGTKNLNQAAKDTTRTFLVIFFSGTLKGALWGTLAGSAVGAVYRTGMNYFNR